MASVPIHAVSVDNDFARFGSKSYAINKINSVDVRERAPYGSGGAVICAVIALFCVLSVFEGGSGGTVLATIVFIALAVWQWRRSLIREYLLFLMTSSSETQAFLSEDEDEVMDLRERIEAAMLSHSRRGSY